MTQPSTNPVATAAALQQNRPDHWRRFLETALAEHTLAIARARLALSLVEQYRRDMAASPHYPSVSDTSVLCLNAHCDTIAHLHDARTARYAVKLAKDAVRVLASPKED